DYKLEARMRTANRQVYTITTAENAVSTETWHHVALAYDGDSLRLYIDGNQAGITPASGEITNTQETFKIGSLDFASLYHFDLDGQVDEVRVWTIARSQQEIMDNMYAVLDGNEDGLAGYWGFDEGYGNMVQDLSGNGYDGTIVGAANWSENVPAGDSAPNYSLSFDGENDRIEIPDSDVLDITNELTLEAWIKPSVSYGTEAIIRKNSAFSLERQGTSAFGRVVIDGQGKMLWAYGALTGFENEWIHLAFTYDGSVATVYVNGEQFSSGTDFQGDIDTSNDNLLIGATLPEMENFQGGIDEARTWNYALNQDEIQSYINAPPTGDEQGLIGYWNFNEGDGDVVYDLSGN
ncbi:MAG TPA: LamG domain-containing protein, partial [Candidatus Marinimicrobia bacterium]|nr:LamG domain-containing protein [Candidatus Neomarinimicrobiota bacterium]